MPALTERRERVLGTLTDRRSRVIGTLTERRARIFGGIDPIWIVIYGMSMSAVTMYQGLEERFRTINGLTSIMLGEPTTIQSAPALYTAFAGFERSQHGQVTAMRYRFTHRLVIVWQDNPQAEMQLLTLLNAIPASVDVSPTLGGRIVEGLAKVTTGDTGYATISKTLYRICDMTSDVLEKGPVRGGL